MSDAHDPRTIKSSPSIREPFVAPEIKYLSRSMAKLMGQIGRVSPTSVSVLVTGESGTGKELVARAIHANSPRSKSGPFIAVNCAALSENLLEAELFGCKRGAYTGATSDTKGYFEACHGGTLFLDEIGETPPNLQVKLLRVLQESEITPIGGRCPVKVDVRIVSATNRNLFAEMQAGNFRRDLYFRLSSLTLEIPPLRARPTDIPVLIRHFLRLANKAFNKSVKFPDPKTLEQLQLHSWPGNVRELQSTINRLVLFADDDQCDWSGPWNQASGDFPDMVDSKFGASEARLSETDPKYTKKEHGRWSLNFHAAKQEFEKQYFRQLLEAAHGNISEAARLSGQYRPVIYRYLQKYDLEAGKFRI